MKPIVAVRKNDKQVHLPFADITLLQNGSKIGSILKKTK